MRAVAAGVALALGVAACGGGSSKSTATKARPGSPASTHTPAGGASSVATGPVRATLRGADHAPKANKPWAYSVHVTDAAGRRLSGTVEIRFTFAGQVVGRDTPPAHPIRNGLWHDKLTFPNAAIGQPLTVQAVVHTSAGSVTLGWPITVRP